ncbi:unnamed protein product [Clonostachys rosea]|uniref:Gfo/Idh/MocA-like oxidoreductase N-terminal domain-containing protein n=1 Tax=Bionectria ochroleuca TaxID=29856 RepID=A0ABY6UG48_BIOOC|nr:unnamed protein product [Clonostachys rosea]
MGVIRVGVIGLTALESSTLGPRTWAVVSFLPSFVNSPDYEIVAVCNSTVASSLQAIETHKLPKTTKAYGNPSDLANDPNVDLVVVSVRVTKHLMLAEPALLAKKQVFVEWPLGASTTEAERLAELARTRNLKTIVGVQARADPLIVKAKQLVDSGALGTITSSSVFGSTSAVPSDVWFKGSEFYLDMKTGANLFHVYFGHFLDSFIHVLGGFDSLQSSLQTEIAEIVIPAEDGVQEHTAQKNVPDHVLVQGKLKSGAMASIAYRWANLNEAVDDVGVRWIITGRNGEIEITTDQSHWQMNSPNRKLRLKLKGAPTKEIDFSSPEPDFIKHIPQIGKNTGRILEAYARGNQADYADFESALETHKLLDEIVQKSGFKY